jgi:N,N'-diacetylbacillosaminyl-diphospho-undecaprenol alpha-1,3-N-acetylgalactosaminyltransferase
MSTLPGVLIVGGPDVNARLELMHSLSDHFEISAVGSLPSLHDKFSAEGFRYYSYDLNRGVNLLGDLKTLFQLIAIFRELKPQIVHTFDTKPGVWARLAARLAGVPVIIGTLPGLGSLYIDESFKYRVVRSMYEQLQRLACNLSDLTIFQNWDDIRQFIKAGVVPTQKTKVILGSGINTNLFSPDSISEAAKARLKIEFNVQPNEVLVTMVSRVIRSKGIFEFMQSAREIQKNNPDVRFLLIGGEDDESMDRLTQEEMAQLKQVVDWRGQRSDISIILAISDIFVLPSVYREGIPRVLLEAAAMNLPIVTTNSPGCKEVVENEKNGFLIPMHDAEALSAAITRLVEVPGICRRFGLVSRQKAVQIFDTNIISGQTRNVYEQFISIEHAQDKKTRLIRELKALEQT